MTASDGQWRVTRRKWQQPIKNCCHFIVIGCHTYFIGGLLDCLPEGKKLGGAPANFAYHVSRFGSLAQRNAVTRSTVQKFLDTMSPIGTLTVFDINLRQHWYSKEIIEGSLIRCNVLKLNDEEIVTVSELLGLGQVPSHTDESPLQLVDFEDQCHEIMQRYELQMLILTCGINGSYVFCSDGRVSFQPTPKVDVADTVGAGDSFTGSFVASLLKGKSMEEAHRRAVEVSAYVCTQNGAMPQMPEKYVKD